MKTPEKENLSTILCLMLLRSNNSFKKNISLQTIRLQIIYTYIQDLVLDIP